VKLDQTGVAVIGVGAIGGLIAAELLAAGHEVALCTRTPLQRLVVERDTHPRDVAVPAIAPPRVRFAVVALKGQDSAQAMPWLERLTPEVVVVIQNGVEHEAHIDHPRLVPAIANTAVERIGPGHLIHRAGDQLTLADRPGAAEFAALLDGSALQTQLEPDFTTAAWRKLLTNLAGNPLTAITQRRSDVYALPEVRELVLALVGEALSVARAEGAQLPDSAPQEVLDGLSSLPLDVGSSMLSDRLAGRPLEVEPLVGAVLRAARRHGLQAPRTQTLYALLRAI
jgi:2-dehydropantoate 2-reductase